MSERAGTRGPGDGGRAWPQTVAVVAGGAVGALARSGVSVALPDDPVGVGTVVVNLVGALLLGVLVARPMGDVAAVFWRAGVLGAFTTFSAMSADAAALGWWGAPYLLVVVGSGLAAAHVGLRAGRAVAVRRMPEDGAGEQGPP
ncbi:CrcB family protein [Euzebya tangerina]|uniref:CrcB family protein n=1 Tax=Euzebya tangerina TaxID=591198 RepID=UPI000E322186|nr:CrcB family protein [Euzebya tangerina]